MKLAPFKSLRGRLLLLALVVEALMLGLLVSNSLRLLRDNMGEQAKDNAEQIAPVLRAALVAPMAQYDYVTVQAVLDESKAIRGIDYLAVSDNQGHIVAVSGWPIEKSLPVPDTVFLAALKDKPARYDVVQPMTLAGQPLGSLHFGLDLSRIIEARRNLLTQGIVIAVSELLLSAGLLTLLGLLITRQLTTLTRASIAVARGGAMPAAVPEGDDDIGRLGAAFNAMSRAVSDRVAQLTQARDEVSRLAATMELEHARLSSLLAAMEFGILFSDDQDNIVYYNHALIEQWHIDPAENLHGTALSALFSRLARFTDQLHPADDAWLNLASGQELKLADGHTLVLHRRHVPGADQTLLGELWLFADITERRRFEQQLVEAKNGAEAANVAKSQFLATMSHEIRTPMNGILGMAQLLQMPEIDDYERRDYVQTILSSGQTLLTLLNDILDLSKVEAGKLDLELTPVDPARILLDTEVLFREAAQHKKLLLTARWQGPSQQYCLDPVRLRQMLTNLVSNAIKFTEAGQVQILATESSREADRAVLEFAVIDSGIGLPPDKLHVVFQPFSQADSTITRKFGGTGLGLSIVRSLAEKMGGTAGVDSREGQGSRFWFRITAALARPSSACPAEPDGAPVANMGHRIGGVGKILVVDDNRINLKVVSLMLGKLGFSVDSAENGQQAVDALKQGLNVDLVLMDCQMPVLDGFAATRQIRRWELECGLPRTRIVALTAGAFEEDRQHCLAAGMDDFLTKPVDLDRLSQVLKRRAAPPTGIA